MSSIGILALATQVSGVEVIWAEAVRRMLPCWTFTSISQSSRAWLSSWRFWLLSVSTRTTMMIKHDGKPASPHHPSHSAHCPDGLTAPLKDITVVVIFIIIIIVIFINIVIIIIHHSSSSSSIITIFIDHCHCYLHQSCQYHHHCDHLCHRRRAKKRLKFSVLDNRTLDFCHILFKTLENWWRK